MRACDFINTGNMLILVNIPANDVCEMARVPRKPWFCCRFRADRHLAGTESSYFP
jgi:hypothetical protein